MTHINDINTPVSVMRAILKLHPNDRPCDTPVIPVRLLTIGMQIDISAHLEHILQRDVPTLATPSLFDANRLKRAINWASDEWLTVTSLSYDAATERILVTLDESVVPTIAFDPNDYVPIYAEGGDLKGTIWEEY